MGTKCLCRKVAPPLHIVSICDNRKVLRVVLVDVQLNGIARRNLNRCNWNCAHLIGSCGFFENFNYAHTDKKMAEFELNNKKSK